MAELSDQAGVYTVGGFEIQMKNKMTRRLVMLTVATAALALAQGPGPGRGHGGPGRDGGTPPTPAQMVEMRVNMMARRLTLTDAQKAQATTIFTQAESSTAAARESLKSVHTQMNDAVKKNDTGGITTLSVTLGTLTTQLVSAERKADAAFYAILTAEQKATFDKRGPGGMGGPGGMMGGPGMMNHGGGGPDRMHHNPPPPPPQD